MAHPSIDDDEVASVFGRNARWAAGIRARREQLRAREPFPERYEWLDESIRPTDPGAEEIAAGCLEMRSRWKDGVEGTGESMRRCAI
jgi:hypothetical protein